MKMSYLFMIAILVSASSAFANYDVTCANKDCMHKGWTVTDTVTNASLTVTCNGGDCNANGWASAEKDLRSEDTVCKPGGCFVAGWRSYASQNGQLTTDVTCLSTFGGTTDCLTNGWSTFVAGRGSYMTSCSQNDCRKVGWDVNGQPVARCKADGCFVSGWTVYN